MLRGVNIDCETCVMRSTAACADCVVTFIVGREPGDAIVIDAEEERAVRLLSGAGLVPRLRHVAPGHGHRPVARVACVARPPMPQHEPRRRTPD